MRLQRKTLQALIEGIGPVNAEARSQAQARLDSLTKPRGSLGRLEELAMRYCAARGTASPQLRRKRICCFAADHGVARQGVSAFPSEVTAQMVRNMLAGGAAINALSRLAGAELAVIDVGVADPLQGAEGLVRRKVRPGTADMSEGPAMSADEAEAAVAAGVEMAEAAAADGVDILGTGDMGIANTTAATALFAAYLGLPAEGITGSGTGIDEPQRRHKTAVIERALAVNRERLKTPLQILAAVGGLEIAAICGLCLGGAANKIPVAVDGFISTAGAVAAIKMNERVKEYLFFSHLSQERGHAAVMSALGARPILALDMRLGEGTGAALAMIMLEAALKIYREMATFESAAVSTGSDPTPQ